MRTKTLQQTVKFKASPREVYHMLMAKNESLSGQSAKINRKVRWRIHRVGLLHLSCDQAWSEHRAGVARHWMVGRTTIQSRHRGQRLQARTARGGTAWGQGQVANILKRKRAGQHEPRSPPRRRCGTRNSSTMLHITHSLLQTCYGFLNLDEISSNLVNIVLCGDYLERSKSVVHQFPRNNLRDTTSPTLSCDS
jgi:hypothetical protein